MLTFTVSSFRHQLLGRPVPEMLEGTPLIPFGVTAGAAGALATLQGSSVVYARVGTGARTSEVVR